VCKKGKIKDKKWAQKRAHFNVDFMTIKTCQFGAKKSKKKHW
jgi:hypothetical protein